jgi:hypothetical protein
MGDDGRAVARLTTRWLRRRGKCSEVGVRSDDLETKKIHFIPKRDCLKNYQNNQEG